MAENLWRWHRRQAVVAISFLLSFGASAQDVPAPTPGQLQDRPIAADASPKVAKTALRDLRLSALSQNNKIAIDWRFVSDGKSIKVVPERTQPEISIEGVKARKSETSSFSNQNIEATIIVLLSGRNQAELEYMRATTEAAITALPDRLYRILVGVDGPSFSWVKDKRVSKTDQLSDVFSKDLIKGVSPSGPAAALTTGYAAALSSLKSASPRARAAILVPEPLLPKNQDLLNRLSRAAFNQRISFFPVAPKGGVSAARAQIMIDFAGPTAGRFLPDALGGRPGAERKAMFAEFLGGQSQVFTIHKHDLYSLPFESPKPAMVRINHTDLTDTLSLNIDRKPLRGAALLGAWINPAYWGRWLATPGRHIWGLLSLFAWLLTLVFLLRLIFPPVRLWVQIAGEDPVQKVRRLPAIIGRSADKAIHLGHEGVSRNHAVIEVKGKQLQLRDMGSTNGTFIAGEKIDTINLKTVQTVQIGPVKIILRTKA